MTEDSTRADAEPTPSESDGAFPASQSFALLSTPRRRETVALLSEHGDVTLPDIAEAVTVRELGEDITEIPPEAVTETYMMLYHSDIPKLVDEDVVVYDQEHDIVATGDRFDPVETLLSETTDY